MAKLFVDRTTRNWIVLDREGNYWSIRGEDEQPWNRRQPFEPSDSTELEVVPGHYRYMLGIPA